MAIQFDNSVATTLTLAAPTSGSATLTFPAADGTSAQTLITDGSGNLTWGAIPAVVTSGLTTTQNTAAPNVTVNISALTIATTGSSTIQNLAIVPKGAGSLISRIPTSTATGNYNLDIQRTTVAASVNKGTNNVILGGDSNSIEGTYNSIVGCYGLGTFAQSPPNCVALSVGNPTTSSSNGYVTSNLGGVAVVGIEKAEHQFQHSTAFMGKYSKDSWDYEHVLSGFGYDPNGSLVPSKYSYTMFNGQTAGSGAGNAVRLYSNYTVGTTGNYQGNFRMQSREVSFFWGWVIASNSSAGGVCTAWEVAGLVLNDASGVASFVGSPIAANLGGDASLNTSVFTIGVATSGSTGTNYLTFTAQSSLAGTTNFMFACQRLRVGIY